MPTHIVSHGYVTHTVTFPVTKVLISPQDQTSQTSTIRILKPYDVTYDIEAALGTAENGVYTLEQRWSYYVSCYTSVDPTEGVPYIRVAAPFLSRTIRDLYKQAQQQGFDMATLGTDNLLFRGDLGRLDRLRGKENLGLRISPDSYHIHWTPNSYEYFVAAQPGPTAVAKNAPIDPAAAATETTVPTAATSTTTEPPTDPSTATATPPTQPPAVSAPVAEAAVNKLTATAAEQHDDRASDFEEKFVMNNRWMAGLTRDEVEGRKGGFRTWIGEGGDGLEKDGKGAKGKLGERLDVVMQD